MRSKNVFAERRPAAAVMEKDPDTKYVKEKVKAIITAIGDVKDMEKGDEIWHPGSWTKAEAMYRHYIGALAKMKGAGAVLEQEIKGVPEATRTCILIARALRSDAAVKDDMMKILKDAK